MEYWNTLILAGSALLLVAIVASDISSRMGAPLLLVFLTLGMLAGEDGPGGLHFDDFEAAYVIGTLALAVIIFDGGLRTRRETFRVGLWPAVSLATIGVVATAVIVGLVAAKLFNLHWLQGLLIGAIVGSTDAAAVFAVLRTSGATLKARVGATLEIESGSNDPMAVFLTVALLESIAAGRNPDASVALALAEQFAIGGALGWGGGRVLVWLINRLNLITGLYPLLAVVGGVLIFALAAQLGGSGFLAIYLAGFVMGNAKLQAAQNILRVHDGLAWLAQIGMFLLLGLLVTPSQLLDIAVPALAVSVVLILVARPVAVFLSLAPFRFPWREQVFVGWVGLRGAVPIVLALFPIMYGLENARLYFNIAFFVVLVSLLLQGWTVATAARWLGLEVPPHAEPAQRVTLDMPGHFEHEIVCFETQAGSLIADCDPSQLVLPAGVQLMAVIRDGVPQPLGTVRLATGDYVYLLARPEDLGALGQIFDAHRVPQRLVENRYFGDFTLNGEATLADVASVYSLPLSDKVAGKTLAEYLDEVFHGRTVVGDRAPLGAAEVVVRELKDGRVTKVGLRLPPPAPEAD